MQEFRQITSKDNPLIKFVIGLQNSAKERRDSGLFVLEGLRICLDAYDNGIKFNKLIVTENAINKNAAAVKNLKSVSENC